MPPGPWVSFHSYPHVGTPFTLFPSSLSVGTRSMGNTSA